MGVHSFYPDARQRTSISIWWWRPQTKTSIKQSKEVYHASYHCSCVFLFIILC